MNHFNKQVFIKALLTIQTLTLVIYTALVFWGDHGNLFQVFISNIASLDWNGQFNLDFSCYLTLSGLWIMWRNQFTLSSILVAIAAMVVGIMVFAPYLLYLVAKEQGDLVKVIIGNRTKV